MADLRIADAPEIALENITGNEKVPTGGYGNSAVTINIIGQFAKNTLSLATEEYVSNAVGQKENKIVLTGLNLTPTATLVEIPQTNNSVLNTIHQDLLNRMEWIKDNATVITDHQALTNRSTFNTHPSSSISHNGTSNVSIEIEDLKNNFAIINNTTIPELKNDVTGKQDVIVNDVNLTAVSELSNVPSTNNSALNNSLQALINRDKFINDKIKTGLPPTFDSNFSTEIGGYPLNTRLMLDNGDIVQSTIANNVNNPNSNMSGWVKKGGIATTESISSLLSIQNPKDGDITNVLSYHGGLGKGGGWFVYDSSKSSINDGVVIFNGWVRDLSEKLLTTDMVGLTGEPSVDGDSTNKLKLLAAAAIGFTGTEIRLLGKFNTTEPVIFTKLKDCLINFGEFSYVTGVDAIHNSNSCRGAINLLNCKNTHIKYVKVVGARMPYARLNQEDGQGGICLSSSDGCTVRLCDISETHTWSILAVNCSNTKVFLNKCKGVARQSGINIWVGAGENNIAFSNQTSECGLYGIEIESSLGGVQNGTKAYNNLSYNCMYGTCVVGNQNNISVYDNQIDHCMWGFALSIAPEITKQNNTIRENTINSCIYGLFVARTLSSNIIKNNVDGKLTDDLYYISTPYSSIIGTDNPTTIYLINSAPKVNGFAWAVGNAVRINGVETTISAIEKISSYGAYSGPSYNGTDTFLKVTLANPVSNLKVGDFLYVKNSSLALTTYGAVVGAGTFSIFEQNSFKNVTYGTRIDLVDNVGNLRFINNEVSATTGAFRFTNTLSTAAVNVNIEKLSLLDSTRIINNAESNSLNSIKNLFSNKQLKTNKTIDIAYPTAVTYGQFGSSPIANLTRDYYSNERLCLVGLSVDYVSLKAVSGGPALIVNDTNTNLTLAQNKSTETTNEEVGALNPMNLNGNFTYKFTTTGATNDLGYASLVFRLHCI